MARVLVVDDSAVMRRNLKSFLTWAGHEVVAEAINGGQAHTLYKKHQPELVTMDITMPEINGIEAVKLIMKDFPDAKIIMISALDQKEMVLEALQNGAKHYILKPIKSEAVVSVINKVLGTNPEVAATAEAKSEGVKKQAEIVEKDEELEPQSPFMIENKNLMFHITLTKLLDKDNLGSLQQAAQGLLYVKPLKVRIDFDSLEELNNTILKKIGEIIKLIQDAHGSVTVTAKNEKFIKSVKENYISGLSELIM